MYNCGGFSDGYDMNKVKVLVAFVSLFFMGTGIADADIAERIKKVGEVCIEGKECGAAQVAGAAAGGASVDENYNKTQVVVAAAGSASVEENYNKSCAVCHITGVAGAPLLDDTAAWEPRIAKGMDTLYNSVINGLPPAMPAKGMCFSCSDDDLRALVNYMVDSLK